MYFDSNNKIVQLCIQGMTFEGEGKIEEAKNSFIRAWDESASDFEKFTSAHYVARHQNSTLDKLKWDKIALEYALKIDNEEIKGGYPSLYLNIGKDYEDMGDMENARVNYLLAESYAHYLLDDGYGKMIKSGIDNALSKI